MLKCRSWGLQSISISVALRTFLFKKLSVIIELLFEKNRHRRCPTRPLRTGTIWKCNQGWGRRVPWEVSQRPVRLEFGIGKWSSWSDVLVDGSCCISRSPSWAEAKTSSSTGAWAIAETFQERPSTTWMDSPWIWWIPLVNLENTRWRAWQGQRRSLGARL